MDNKHIKKIILFLTLLLFCTVPKTLYAQTGPPSMEIPGTPINELKTEFRPFFLDPMGFNLFPNIFARPPVVPPSMSNVKVSPKIAAFDTINVVEKVIGGKKVWVRLKYKGNDILTREIEEEKIKPKIARLLQKKNWAKEDKNQALKIQNKLLGMVHKTKRNFVSLQKTYRKKLKQKESWKANPSKYETPNFNFTGAEKTLIGYEKSLHRWIQYIFKIEQHLGKHKGSLNEIQLFWGWKNLIVKAGKLVYRLTKTGLKVIKHASIAVIKFGAGVAYAVIRTGIEPLLITADLLRFLFGAEKAWSFTGQLAIHVGKVGIKQATLDMVTGIITLPVEMAKAFYEEKYFALGEMTGYLIAGKMKLPIKFVPKGRKIIIKFAKESIEKLKKYLKEKGTKLSKATKEKLQKQLAFLEENSVLAVLHSIEEAFKEWVKKKMVPHLGAKISKHLENYGMFGPKGEKTLRKLLSKEEQAIMGVISEVFKELQKNFEQYISGK